MRITGVLTSHFVPGQGPNVDMITVEGTNLVMPNPSGKFNVWPFGHIGRQVEITTHRFKRVRVEGVWVRVVRTFRFLDE